MRLVRRKPKRLDGYGKLELEKVIGLTTGTASGLACNGVSEELAYLAGCVIVIYNVRTNSQTHLLMACGSPKPFACVAFSSQGGKFIAAGESGHQPAVLVWEVATGTCIADMKSHKYGVSCVQFSPNGKHLVSLGIPHDGYICLWDWKSGVLLMKTRAAAASLSATTLQFATDGSFFVSGGTKHLKHWTIGGPRARSSSMTTNPGMDGKPVKLGSQNEKLFVCVSSAAAPKEQIAGAPTHQPIYALTSAGVLCLLHGGLAIEKWVDLQVRQSYAVAISEGYVACACSDGIVRIFSQGSLEYTATLPRPAPHGYHGLTDANVGAYLAVGHRVTSGIKFPDAIACTYLQQGQNLAVIYDDHSLYVWDVRSYAKIGRLRTFLSHSGCIWDVVTLPEPFLSTNVTSAFQGEAFATCSADGTIRLWHLDLGQDDNAKASIVHSSSSSERPQNVYSKDILGVLYIGMFFNDGPLLSRQASHNLGEQKGRLSIVGTEEESIDTAVGFRSITVSPDGNHLAAGDSNGNLRIYDLNSLLLHSFQEAHDAEILSLSFTTVFSDDDGRKTDAFTVSLLASGGRDRLIHIYDVNRGYDVVETLDDHTASITTVRFACSGSKLLSCSADKSVVFRNVAVTSSGCKSSRYHQEVATRGTIYDMDIDASDKLVVAVGQDKKINILSLATGRPVRSFKPEGDVGEPIKGRMDPSGMYVVCSHSDRYMRVYNFITGELLAEASGHAEVITGVTFLPDCRRLISVSGDSCIFVWRLPLTLSRAMRKRCSGIADSRPPLKTLQSFVPRSTINEGFRAAKIPRVNQQKQQIKVDRAILNENACPTRQDENLIEPKGTDHEDVDTAHKQAEGAEVGEETPAAFKFSVSRLPSWAQSKISHEEASTSGGKEEPDVTGGTRKAFHSRWAERLGSEGYKLFSEFMEEITPPATIRASGFGAKRRFSVEGGSAADSDSTPGSSTSQLQSSPMSSPREAPRKETQWTTVHTVFLDDSDFDDTPTFVPLPQGDQAGVAQVRSQEKASIDPVRQKVETEDADHVTVDTSNDDGEPAAIKAAVEVEEIVYYTPGSAPAVVKSNGDDTVVFEVSSKDKTEVIEDSRSAPSSPLNGTKKDDDHDGDIKRLSRFDSDKLSVESDEGEVEDDEFRPRRDLFSAHFDKLASDPKVGASARKSFSARFFAKSNTKLSQSTLFPSSPAGNGMKASNESQASVKDSDVLEPTSGNIGVAGKERRKPQEQQDACTVQLKEERVVNLSGADSGTLTTVVGTENGSAETTNEETCNHESEISPQMPDLLPSRSPQLTPRKGGLPPKYKTGSPMAFPNPADENVLASPALSSRFQDKNMKRKVSDCIEQVICDEVQKENLSRSNTGTRFGTPRASDTSTSTPFAAKQLFVAAPSVLKQQNSGNKIQIPAALGIVNPCGMPREHDMQSELEKEGREEVVSASTSGLSAVCSDLEEPFHSSWETFSARRSTMKALPRPVEDYQRALKELMDAARKASILFDEVRSFCHKSTSAESSIQSLIPSTPSLPSDVVHSGQAYQKLMPEILQLIQKLSDKVSVCDFSPDSSEAKKSSDDASLYNFSFHKSSDYVDNGLQSWPRTSAASLDSLLSSVDVESLISRYSETLASQVLALVQKSLPPAPA